MKPLKNSHHLKTRNSYDYPEGSLMDVIVKYKGSFFWKDLADVTRRDYGHYITLLQEWSIQNKHPYIKNISPADILKFLQYFEKTPVRQRRAKVVMSVLWSTAVQYGYIRHNIIKDIKLRRKNKKIRQVVYWSDKDAKSFIMTAIDNKRPSMAVAVALAFYTCQRQKDILNMLKSEHLQGSYLRVTQSKTGKKVLIPLLSDLEKYFELVPVDQDHLVINENTGNPYVGTNFTHVFRDLADKAGLADHWFMELRHSGIRNLYRAGCTKFEIASISGHSLSSIEAMLANHYLELRDAEVAQQAMNKLEQYRSTNNERMRDGNRY